MKSKIAQNLSYRFFFFNFGPRRDSPQQINCENFIIGCTVGFGAILDQRQVFTTLDENWIAHALYLSARSCDAMYRVRESMSKLELFTRCLPSFFAIFFGPRLEYMFELSLKLSLQRFNAFQVLKWFFVTSWGYLRHFCTLDKYWRVAFYRSAR